MECTYSECHCEIPDAKRSNSRYCSDNCYRLAKKVRDKADYNFKMQKLVKYNQNLKILEFFAKIKSPISKTNLLAAGFDIFSFDKIANTSSQIIIWIGSYVLRGDKVQPESPKGKVTVQSFLITRQ